VGDPFNVTQVRVRQPGKIFNGRASYEIYGDRKELLAVATEVAGRSVLEKVTGILPGSRWLMVTGAAGEPLYSFAYNGGKFVAELTGPDDRLVGKIRIGASRRHYTLVNELDEVVGEVVGDLAVRRFTVTGPGNVPLAEFRKTFAGPVKEAFTSADHYLVTFAATPIPPLTRTLTVFVSIALDLARYGPA
jgi:hypothetical protein